MTCFASNRRLVKERINGKVKVIEKNLNTKLNASHSTTKVNNNGGNVNREEVIRR
jgi:hypothetical protein